MRYNAYRSCQSSVRLKWLGQGTGPALAVAATNPILPATFLQGVGERPSQPHWFALTLRATAPWPSTMQVSNTEPAGIVRLGRELSTLRRPSQFGVWNE